MLPQRSVRRRSHKWPPGSCSDNDYPGPCADVSPNVCAATVQQPESNVLKCWEKHQRRNAVVCSSFASSENLWKLSRRPRMAEVRGSSPLGSTSFFLLFAGKT